MDKNSLTTSKNKNRTSDGDKWGELAELVETLTHSGQKQLDTVKLKEVKRICQKSDKNVEQVYHLIIHQLQKNHAEIRYSAFQLLDVIFRRSHSFRLLAVDNLRQIFELTAETNPECSLPPPLTVSNNLKKLSLRTVSEWCKQYGPRYKKLVLGFNYLKNCKKVDFSALQLQNDAERSREEEKQRRLLAINKERIKKVESDLNDLSLDISTAVKSLMNGLDLLLPKPEEFFISLDEENCEKNGTLDVKTDTIETPVTKFEVIKHDDDSSSDDDDYEEAEYYSILRDVGALSNKHSIEINLNVENMKCLKETAENEAILDNVRDQVKLITNTYLPRVKGWLQILTKVSGQEPLLKRIVDLKANLEISLEKYSRLNIKSLEDDGVSTDSELEEVKESVSGKSNRCRSETNILNSENLVNESQKWSIVSKEEASEDPTTVQARLLSYKQHTNLQKTKSDESNTTVIEPQPSTSDNFTTSSTVTITEDDKELNDRKKKLLAIAPKLPFDIDLYHWEDDKLETPTLLPTSIDQNKFWSSVSGEEFMELSVPEGTSALRTRVIEYVGEFTPVTKSCRAPLSNGKLCPRKDRFKCPFHGIIVPRDETGNCVNLEDKERVQKAEEEKVPEWQDPKLLKEIKEATGIDLKMPDKKGKRRKKQKYPGLTDLKNKQNTATNRLSKKLFNKASVKRIARTLDSIDHRRFRDKYGDQFHYMHDTA